MSIEYFVLFKNYRRGIDLLSSILIAIIIVNPKSIKLIRTAAQGKI